MYHYYIFKLKFQYQPLKKARISGDPVCISEMLGMYQSAGIGRDATDPH